MFDEIKKILDIAVWAPSGDNSQPWYFKIKDNSLSIFNVPEADPPFFNFEQKGSLVAHGALIENIDIAAKNFGYKADFKYFPDGFNKNLISVVYFEKAQPEHQDLFDYIKERCTNRKPYRKGPLSDEQKQELRTALKTGLNGVKIIFTEDQEKMDIIGKASATNEKIVLRTKMMHGLFFERVVWSEVDERKQKSGLYSKTMELGPKEFIFRLARKWSSMRLLNLFGLANLIAADNAKLYASGGAFVSIVMPENSQADFINTGRAMQRIWLTATKLKLSVHPVGGIIFLMQRIMADKATELKNKTVKELEYAYNQIVEAIGQKGQPGFLTFLLRIGESDPPSARCSRREPKIIE